LEPLAILQDAGQKIVLWLRSGVPTPAQCQEGIDADVVILTSGKGEVYFGGSDPMERSVSSGIRGGTVFVPLRFEGSHLWETPAVVDQVRAIIETTFGP